MPSYYEFFAGGGMARAGLGKGWACLFANDIDRKKAAAYERNWGGEGLVVADVGALKPGDLPGRADLAWASFPCQDLSLAGAGAGLKGERSGTFWPFWRLMEALGRKGRAPALVALENVCGALASHKGRDFARICAALAGADYRLGAMVVDAVSFVPQSRPRLFIVAAHESIFVPPILQANGPSPLWHPRMLTEAHAVLDKRTAEKWIWWSMPAPQGRRKTFAEIVEDEPKGVRWHTAAETDRLLVMMDDVNLLKVHKAQLARRRAVGAIYKRTRLNRNGGKVQRAEIRFDVAGCLRTPAGGSSRQTILMVEGSKVRSRLISPRETARLMGLPDGYKLPENYNEAYHLTGDGVVAPVVRHVASNILEPILFSAETMSAAAE